MSNVKQGRKYLAHFQLQNVARHLIPDSHQTSLADLALIFNHNVDIDRLDIGYKLVSGTLTSYSFFHCDSVQSAYESIIIDMFGSQTCRGLARGFSQFTPSRPERETRRRFPLRPNCIPTHSYYS